MSNTQRQPPLQLTEPPHPVGLPDGDELGRLLFRTILFLEPDRMVHPPSWLEHVPFAFWLIDVLRPRVFVELGTHAGNSYAAFAQAVQHLGLDSAGYAIDTWKGDPQAGFYDESVFTEWKDYHDRRYSSFSRLVRTTFDDAVEHFPDRGIDLLHLDGYHTVEAVNHDFDTWLPKLSARAVVILHDINVREADLGAWQVWQQLRQIYPSFEFLHGHGLGVLAVGAEVPAEIAWLMGKRIDPAHIVAVRQFFARIGGGVLARYRALALQREAEARIQEAAVARDAQIAEMKGQLAAMETCLEEARAAQRVARNEADQLCTTVQAAELRVASLLTAISRRDMDRARQEALLRLPTDALAAASRRLEGLRTRTRVLARAPDNAQPSAPSRSGRMWATLRALGVTPAQIVRRPPAIGTLLRLGLRPRALRDAHLIAQSGLFNAGYYGRTYPDVGGSGITPLAHFVMKGVMDGRAPCQLFDSGWYLTKYPDVAASRANPLAHYLRVASCEDRDPHPLFSSGYYRSQLAHCDSAGVDPLRHYMTHGMREGKSPHPLFDPEYYIETYGTALQEIDPFSHFLEQGAAKDFNPHPLFDVAYYRSRAPELKASSLNPLRHYLEIGSARGWRPHPLFDPAFYRAVNRDVAAGGLEPLTHYVTAGGRECRQPIREFDSGWYLATYPDVAQSGRNPLIHFVRDGWFERRNPSPHFDTVAYLSRYPDVVRSGMNPLAHYLERGLAEGRTCLPDDDLEPLPELSGDERVRLSASNLTPGPRPNRVVVCLTHVMPLNPRAGNEYRIYRLLRWLRQSGYVVIPIVARIDGTRPTTDEIEALADTFGNAIVCPTDGRVEYILRDVPDVLQSLDGDVTRRFVTMLGEDRAASVREQELLGIDRAFCSDALIATVLRLQSVLGPYVLLAEYIWMSRVLPLVGSRALKIIDTIDVFSTRAEKVEQFGVRDLTVEADAERLRLARADLILAIQENERSVLESLAPGVPVVTGGVDFDVVPESGAPIGRRILYVASGNPMNRRGLRDFLRFAWPRVREQVPDAELMVAGAVGDSVAVAPSGVHLLGQVRDVDALYRECRAVINPAVAGTGVKIKTLEALSHLRPIVTWPNGVDGLSPGVARLCRTVEDWYSFSDHLAEILASDRAAWFSGETRQHLASEMRPDRVYAQLGRMIQAYFDSKTPAPPTAEPGVSS